MFSLLFRGVRLERDQARTLDYKIETPPPPQELLVPLPGCKSVSALRVQKGDLVAQGQLLCEPDNGAAAFSPMNAVVETFRPLEHPQYGRVLCAVLRREPSRREGEALPPEEPADAEEVLRRAQSAGIVDELDGRALFKNLRRMRRNRVALLVVCAMDDSPYATSEIAFLRENPAAVSLGLRLAQTACGAQRAMLAVCSKRELRALRGTLGPEVELLAAGSRYPARALLKRRLRKNGVKASFLGVQACAALCAAVKEGLPQLETVVTVAGDGVERPRNLRVPVGTQAKELLEYCGLRKEASLICFGSVIHGRAVEDLSLPVTAATRCLVALKRAPRVQAHACIGCGRCVEVCPRGILPWYIEEQMQTERPRPENLLHVQSCIGCAACSAVCPSGIDLAETVRRAAAMRKGGGLL